MAKIVLKKDKTIIKSILKKPKVFNINILGLNIKR